MTTFYLVRHGKKEQQAGDVSLTPAGHQEAQLTAQHFAAPIDKSIPFSQLICSPLRRCTETARPIAHALALHPVVDSRLRERANWGDTPGQSFAEFVVEWERCSAERNYAPPGGQSAYTAGRNFATALHDVARTNPDAHVIVVTHGGAITDFLRNQYSAAALTTYNPTYLHMAECSITTVTFDGLQFALQTLAADEHLN
ncbi:MAG: histidine phosphatase family protein [Caldilineaceae bacterium]|nr:histidine phosphatase family protein [Caldilineaceae bacterium]MCB9156501.1 histidine phosphatase family protein [Caldilineaceae bacterium]